MPSPSRSPTATPRERGPRARDDVARRERAGAVAEEDPHTVVVAHHEIETAVGIEVGDGHVGVRNTIRHVVQRRLHREATRPVTGADDERVRLARHQVHFAVTVEVAGREPLDRVCRRHDGRRAELAVAVAQGHTVLAGPIPADHHVLPAVPVQIGGGESVR